MKQFNQNAKVIFVTAQQLAEQRKDSYIGVEHFLLAMVKQENDPAGRILRQSGLQTEHIDELASIPPRVSVKTALELRPTVKQALQTADDEAQRANSYHIRSEHVLIGLMALKNEPFLDKLLAKIGTTPEAIDRRARQALQPRATREEPPPIVETPRPAGASAPGIGVYDQFVERLAALFQRFKTWIRGEPPQGKTANSVKRRHDR